MDSNTLASLLGTGSTRQTGHAQGRGKKRDATEDEGRLFSRFFEEETGKGEKGKESGKTEKALIEGKKEKDAPEETKKHAQQEKAKMEAKAEDLQGKLQEQIRQRMTKMNPMLNYVYNLMYKNPDTLSMAEKQLLKLDQHPEHGVGYKEFNKLLGERGIKLSSLSFNNIAKLAQCETRSQITAFLDRLVEAQRKGEMEEPFSKTLVEKGKEKMAERAAIDRGEIISSPYDNLAAFSQAVKTEQSQEAEKSAQQEKREEVIDQIIKHLEIQNFGTKTELQMRLNPEYLGELKMLITYDEGKMTAKFETTSKEVRELLKEGMSDLTDGFNKKGLKIDHTDVKLVDNFD